MVKSKIKIIVFRKIGAISQAIYLEFLTTGHSFVLTLEVPENDNSNSQYYNFSQPFNSS